MWINHIQGTEGLKRIFGGESVGTEVSLLRACFDHSILKLHIDLSEWPGDPPKKWRDSKYNTIQCELTLTGCDDVVLNHWAVENIGEFRITKLAAEHMLSVKFVSKSGAYINCVCDSATITNISAYKNA